MTQEWKQPASEPRPLVIDTDMETLDEESHRAWTESMAVRPLGKDYLVTCPDSGTHLVSLENSDCTCDGADDEQCRHLRRVAIEINLGRLPAPTRRTVDCAACGEEARASETAVPLCAACHVEPGDVVVDGDGDPSTPLLVVSPPRHRAADVAIASDGPTVAEYPGNEAYDGSEPVVEVVYPDSVSADRSPRRYRFPVSRLADPPDSDSRQALLTEFGLGGIADDR